MRFFLGVLTGMLTMAAVAVTVMERERAARERIVLRKPQPPVDRLARYYIAHVN